MASLATFYGPASVRLSDDGRVTRLSAHRLFEEPKDDTLIKDSLKRVKDQLAQIPEGKSGALVIAVDYKFGVLPTFRSGFAHRTKSGWEIHGEAFISKAEKGASVRAVKTW